MSVGSFVAFKNARDALIVRCVICCVGFFAGHRFGAGVSFSKFATYASHHCDNRRKGSTDCMLLNDVLVSNIVEVPENKRGPPLLKPPFLPGSNELRYDTTAKRKDVLDVAVKFERDTYLPTHVVTFTRYIWDPLGEYDS